MPVEAKTPRLPKPLEDEIRKVAEEIVVGRNAEARKVAALELATKLLRTTNALLQHAGFAAPTQRQAPANIVQTIPAVTNACKLCGREGYWRPKPSQYEPKPGWLCKTHAGPEVLAQREEAVGSALANSLRNAEPINDTALPE